MSDEKMIPLFRSPAMIAACVDGASMWGRLAAEMAVDPEGCGERWVPGFGWVRTPAPLWARAFELLAQIAPGASR